MLGFPKDYLDIGGINEIEACGLIGDPFPVKSFGRLVVAIEGLQAEWLLAKLKIEGDRLVHADRLGAPKLEDESLEVDQGMAENLPLLRDRQARTEASVLRLCLAYLEIKGEGPYGLVVSGGRWRVQGQGDLRKILLALWQLPIFAERCLDAFDAAYPEHPVLTMPSGVDELVLVLCGKNSVGRTTAREVSGEVQNVAVEGWVLQLEDLPESILFPEAGALAVVVYGYRYAERKPDSVLKQACRAGLYPWQPEQQRNSGYTLPALFRPDDCLTAWDVERWRLRAAQEQDEEV